MNAFHTHLCVTDSLAPGSLSVAVLGLNCARIPWVFIFHLLEKCQFWVSWSTGVLCKSGNDLHFKRNAHVSLVHNFTAVIDKINLSSFSLIYLDDFENINRIAPSPQTTTTKRQATLPLRMSTSDYHKASLSSPLTFILCNVTRTTLVCFILANFSMSFRSSLVLFVSVCTDGSLSEMSAVLPCTLSLFCLWDF